MNTEEKDKIRISKLIEYLTKVKEEHGDLVCCYSEPHEYWGDVQQHLSDGYNIGVKNAQPEGPKSGIIEMCVVFGC